MSDRRRPIADLIAELRSAEEHLQLEAKKSLGNAALETVSSFSNEPDLGGGFILFGVVKQNGRYEVVGVPKPEVLTENIQSQVNGQALSAPIRPTIWTEVFEGKPLVAVFVPEARPNEKPIYIRKVGLPKGAFRRIGTSDIHCSDDDLRLFHQLAEETPYEDSIAPHGTMEDLDGDVIESYRMAILSRDPTAEIRDLTRNQTIQALGGAREELGVLKPTIAGVLLFGKPESLRRLFPMIRVDYIRMPGTIWIEDPKAPIESVDVRQPLLVAFRKLYAAILDDLPNTATFREGSPARIDSPTIPERVVREALVNALCHRDYRVHSPTQVIRYANRIEFRNAGHSLIEEERLGEPGSASRNPRIAGVFREMGVAENKGSGIRVMRREMEAAQLARPLFESSRESNRFVATLLFAHLLTAEQRRWLATFGGTLTKEQELALVYCREAGEIRNSVLRDLTGLDTLAASVALRDLRERDLLVSQGAGAQTHYVLAETGELPAETGELPVETGELESSEFSREALLGGLPANLRRRVEDLGKRAPEAEVRDLILELCTLRAWRPAELAALLERRQVKHLTGNHLAPLVKEGKLERTHAEVLTHPDQAYRTRR